MLRATFNSRETSLTPEYLCGVPSVGLEEEGEEFGPVTAPLTWACADVLALVGRSSIRETSGGGKTILRLPLLEATPVSFIWFISMTQKNV